ncbi:hypothetical protein Y032_0372g150 [Ancylostoma ceylanicum]|uniref:Peptidase M12A domain-containing protein n=1 Tax=Ancylostoma ceylanicum TaxID=53326 RepID=A0A016RUR7_9BILA|nr:hypothetical protein Y032_0372g150 [Ancylostoma ceylanicum]
MLIKVDFSGSDRRDPEIVPKKEEDKDRYFGTMGSHMISFIDLAMINSLYNCAEMCKTLRRIVKMEDFDIHATAASASVPEVMVDHYATN